MLKPDISPQLALPTEPAADCPQFATGYLLSAELVLVDLKLARPGAVEGGNVVGGRQTVLLVLRQHIHAVTEGRHDLSLPRDNGVSRRCHCDTCAGG